MQVINFVVVFLLLFLCECVNFDYVIVRVFGCVIDVTAFGKTDHLAKTIAFFVE